MRTLLVLLLACTTTGALIAQPKQSAKKADTKQTTSATQKPAQKATAKSEAKGEVKAKSEVKATSAVKPDPATSKAAMKVTPGASLVPSKSGQQHYEDSAAFQKAFKELFPLIKPQVTIREKTQNNFAMSSKRMGLSVADSTRLLDSLLAAMENGRDEEILFTAYRAAFTAEEIKSITTFLKTPAGKHFMEVEPRLIQARTTEVDRYVNGAVAKALMPFRVAQQNARAQARANSTPNAATPASARSGVNTPQPVVSDSVRSGK